ncbi:MAG: FecR domain-containing protein [Bacteroidota bacterium]
MKIKPELLQRYQQGQCTPEEIIEVEKWLASNEDEASSLDEPQLQNMEEDIWQGLEPMVSKHTPKPVIPLYRQVMRYAAVVVILCAVGFSAYYFFNQSDSNAQTDLAQLEAMESIYTKRGEKRTVTLSDGSTIRMNYETVIKAPQRFEGDQRIVYLTGHAHFDVVRDTERPFIIYTNDSKTQVLGTSFDINTKEATEIIVTSGQVAFSDKANEDNLVTLSVNNRAILDADRSIRTDVVNALALTAWKDNRLVFDGETLEEIIKVLEPWYDIEVTVKDATLLTRDFKLSRDNPSVNIIFQELAFAGDFEYQIEGKQVILF